MTNLVAAPSNRGVSGGRFTISSKKVEAPTSISAGRGFISVGTAGFEPTTPCPPGNMQFASTCPDPQLTLAGTSVVVHQGLVMVTSVVTQLVTQSAQPHRPCPLATYSIRGIPDGDVRAPAVVTEEAVAIITRIRVVIDQVVRTLKRGRSAGRTRPEPGRASFHSKRSRRILSHGSRSGAKQSTMFPEPSKLLRMPDSQHLMAVE